MSKKIISFLAVLGCIMTAACSNSTVSQQESTQPLEMTTALTTIQSETASEATTAATTIQTEATSESTAAITTSPLEAEPQVTIAATTAVTASETSQPEEKVYNKGTAPEITLSGDPADIFVAEEDCYALTENAVLYIKRGATVRGDLGKCAESKMSDICKVTGLDYKLKTEQINDISSIFDVYYDSGSYVGMNEDDSRVNLMLVTLEGDEIQWAGCNFALLDDEDLYYDCETPDTAHHELTHTICLNNGVDIGPTLEEGLATFYSEKMMEQYGCQTWSWIQYYYPYNFDDACIFEGADGFDHAFHDAPDRSFHYAYGFIFCTFLEDTYGNDVFMKIRDAATADSFDASYSLEDETASLAADTEQLKEIIIAVTDADVFDKFAEWYTANWESEKNDWKEYMTSLGEDVSFL